MKLFAVPTSVSPRFEGQSKNAKKAKAMVHLPPLEQLHKLNPDNPKKLRRQLGLKPESSDADVLKAYGLKVRELLKKHLKLSQKAQDSEIHAAMLSQYRQAHPEDVANILSAYVLNPAQVMPAHSDSTQNPFLTTQKTLQEPSSSTRH